MDSLARAIENAVYWQSLFGALETLCFSVMGFFSVAFLSIAIFKWKGDKKDDSV